MPAGQKSEHTGLARLIADAGSAAKHIFPAAALWFRMPGFVSWAAVSAGTFAAFSMPWRLVHGTAPGLTLFLCAAAAGLAIAGILVRRTTLRFSAFFFGAVLWCTLHRGHQVAVYEALLPVISADTPITLSGKVVSPAMPYYENFHCLLRINAADHGLNSRLRGLTVNCITPLEPPRYGTVRVTGVLEPPATRRNPYEYDAFRAMMAKGVWGTFAAHRCEVTERRGSWFEGLSTLFRANALNTLHKMRDYDNRALLQASFLGDTECLSPFLKDTFRKSGIYHLIAISGLNTAMLVAALYFFLRLFPLGRRAPHLICIAALWLYLPFVGMIPSLFRATVMTTFVIAAILVQRKNYAMQTLGLAGTVWLALSPESLFDPGYQLSFAATAGLLLLFPVLNRFQPRANNRFVKMGVTFVFSSLFISLASFLATLPVLLYHFGTLSFFGIIANLIAVSAMTISMWAFFAALLLQMVFPLPAVLPLWVAERFLDIVVAVGKSADFFSWSQMTFPAPWPELFVLFSLLLIGVTAIRPDLLGRYCLAGLAAVCLFVPLDFLAHRSAKSAEVVRFSVDKGVFMAVLWPDRNAWLLSFGAKPAGLRRITPHVLPWVRHRCDNRVDVLMVPAGIADSAAAFSKSTPALARAAVVPLPAASGPAKSRAGPDSLPVRSIPCPGCTCSFVPTDRGLSIGISALGADTLLPLPYPESTGRSAGKGGPAAGGPQDAALLRFCRGKINASGVLPAGHPLAAVPAAR